MNVKEKGRTNSRLSRLYSFLPESVAAEIMGISASVRDFEDVLSEVRLRAHGACSLVLSGRNYPLISTVTSDEIAECYHGITEGALFAHRDSIGVGYLPIGRGIRVGVGGVAGYDGGRLVGVGSISSLVFRMPAARCDYAQELYKEWNELGRRNMLVVSPPLGGKTTALRALARCIGSGADAVRVVAVDARCEFDPEDYDGTMVDLLCGYKREVGIEVAVRTMSAEVIIADEIATVEEANAILGAVGTGVTVITGAHAASFSDIGRRECLLPLLRSGAFEHAALLTRSGGRYGYELGRTGEPDAL